MVVSVLEAGTVTIKNKQTGNSVYLLPDNNGQSLHTKPDDDTDDFKWSIAKLDNGNYTMKNLAAKQFAYVSAPLRKESQVVAKSDKIEWRILGTGTIDVYWIVPTDEDYYWGVSSSVPVSGAPIKLREGRTDPSNHWTIKLVTASSHSGGPSSASLSDVASKSFDYIIVGGGTAGLTVAARLSEDSSTTVCVLEAGDANLNDPVILTPASYAKHFGDKLYDWSHLTTKQKFSGDREFRWPRGRGLGGSSSINFFVWTKPPAQEIDDIERLGNPGWNWKNYQKYAQRVEQFIDPSPEQKQKFNLPVYEGDVGRQGALAFGFPKTLSELELPAHQTLENAGIYRAPRPYGGNPQGYIPCINTQDPRTATRSYAATAYYLPNKDRPNLTVLVHALVGKVLTEKGDDGDLNAVGVEFIRDGKTYSVHAKKEVIVSAGTIKSPQILELSGIGRREILEKAGIAVKVDLRGVGENLQEHCMGRYNFELKPGIDGLTFDVLKNENTRREHEELYKRGEGAFTMGISTYAFLPIEAVSSRPHELYAKAKATVERLTKEGISSGLLDQYKIQLERLEPGKNQSGPGCEIVFVPGFFSPTMPEDSEGKKYVAWCYGTNHMFSRGSIHIAASDPTKDPNIDPRYFEQDIDADILLETAKFVRKLGREVAPMKDMIAKEVTPGPDAQTGEQLIEAMKATYGSTSHTCGTCSMLPKEKGGVVDASLKVYGTNNLRVIDLSILPLHFATHAQASVYIFAEQAADIIKGRFER